MPTCYIHAEEQTGLERRCYPSRARLLAPVRGTRAENGCVSINMCRASVFGRCQLGRLTVTPDEVRVRVQQTLPEPKGPPKPGDRCDANTGMSRTMTVVTPLGQPHHGTELLVSCDQIIGNQAEIAYGHRQRGVSQLSLQHREIAARAQVLRGEGVSDQVRMHVDSTPLGPPGKHLIEPPRR